MFSDHGTASGFFQSNTDPINQQSAGFFQTSQAQNLNQRRYQHEQFKRTKVFVPVSFRMINQALPNAEDQFEYKGQVLADIIVVGRLISRREEPSRTVFEMNDNTVSKRPP